jgi:hypothetical protein
MNCLGSKMAEVRYAQFARGWQVSSIFNQRSGLPIRLSQPSGIDNSRPDSVPASIPIFDNWGKTLRYLNPVPLCSCHLSVDGSHYPPRHAGVISQLRGPHSWTVDTSLAKNFRLTESVRSANSEPILQCPKPREL